MGCGAVSKPVGDANRSNKAQQQQQQQQSQTLLSTGSRKSSKIAVKDVVPTKVVANKPFTQIINPKCCMTRLDHLPEPKVLTIEGDNYNYVTQYCYVSQRGYYPNALGKANQDSYLVCEGLLGDKSCNLFGIFDGHGELGDFCSHYAADQLPHHLSNEMEKEGGTRILQSEKMQDVYIRSFQNTNSGLHASEIDDSLSGSTGITILQKGDQLLVANVGDSRAIIASEVNGKLVYSPLSSDQTPYRKDERERLKRAGAKIMTMDQIEGNEPIHENFGTNLGEEIDQGGDPPRVWDQTLEKPGCAFSRSFGDSVAKVVGVTAEPEILVWDISPRDRFAVVASDGVFEFITSQGVVDMIQKYSDKLAAAKHVVAEAYRLWLTYDDRTDDISIIIIAFDNITPNLNTSASHKSAASKKIPLQRMQSLSKVLNSEELAKESRPVRKVMSKAKRKDIAENWNKDESIAFDFSAIENNKTEEEIARISTMLSSNFMFEKLSPIQKDHIFKVMKSRDVQAAEVIIREGDQGDEMYIIDKGQFNVFKKDANGDDQQVFTYTTEGAAFGELSLMYGKPRAASVVATTAGKLWCIGRAAFRAVMMQGKSEGLLDIYRTIPVLNELPIIDVHRLCLMSKEVTFEKGDIIATEETAHTTNWMLCIVITGVVRLIPKDDSKKRQLRAELSFVSMEEIGSRFKEAIADGTVKLSCIPKSCYSEILGIHGESSMKDAVLKKKSKGKRLQTEKSTLAMDDNKVLPNLGYNIDTFTLDHPISLVGEFGYMANYHDTASNTIVSMRVYSVKKALEASMESKVMTERNHLAILSNTVNVKVGIPSMATTLKSSDKLYILFAERFDCDLSVAIHSQTIPDVAKPYYAACILNAIDKIHHVGLIHRFINSSSVFITRNGLAKVVDFRFAKPLDGSYCFTICGDPLYFAPEIVTQQGYDYAVDLWAFGVLVYELYEGCSPFGTSETDETTIFRAISSFRPSKLEFKSKAITSAGKEFIGSLLKFGAEDRHGYTSLAKLRSMDFFNEIEWDRLHTHKGFPLDIQPSVELPAGFENRSPRNAPTNNAFEHF